MEIDKAICPFMGNTIHIEGENCQLSIVKLEAQEDGSMRVRLKNEESKWIKCSENLPPEWRDIIIFGDKLGVRASQISLSNWYAGTKRLYPEVIDETCYSFADKITHWMPLPEPPNEN